MSLWLLVTAIATLAAFASALLGIGGAIVMLPLLLYLPPLLGLPALPPATATGLATVQVLGASLLGTWLHGRQGAVDRRLIGWVGAGMASTSFLAALASDRLPPRLLIGVFALVATGAGLVLLVPRRASAEPEGWTGNFNRALAWLAGGSAGVLVGLVGSGTFVLTPLLLHALHVPMRLAIGTSLGVAIFGALAAVAGKLASGVIDESLALAVLAGTVPGALLGERLSRVLPAQTLRLLLGLLISSIALRAWWDFALLR